MRAEEIKTNLNKLVIYKSGTEYKLTGAIFRKNDNDKFYYQAELQDIKNNNSILICSLDDIEKKG